MAQVEAARLEEIPRAAQEAERPEQARRPLDWRVGGVLLGLLVTLAVALQGPLGVSGAYVRAEAMAASWLDLPLLRDNAYLRSFGAALSPELLVVIGVIGGGLLGALLQRSRKVDELPRSWRQRFGGRKAVRFLVSFAAGALLLFGARLAGGCTSGHVISGMSQLALSGMVFAAAVFASGIPVALLMYRRKP